MTQIARLIVKDLAETVRGLNASADKVQKAALTAIKVEGFRLMGLLKNDLRRGEAGNVTL